MPARPLLEDRSSPAPAIAITIPIRLIGLILLALVGIVMAALASWSVDDPSLSYAATNPVRNWLGFPGAVIADLSFQVLGLGIIVLLVPLALWGWSFVRRRVPTHMGLRLIAWIAATLLATGVLAFMPAPASWPLPTGLGGLIGAGFTNLAELVAGAEPQPVTAWLFAIILFAPTLALFWLALGLGAMHLPKLAAATGARGKGKTAMAVEDEAERNGILDVAIGGLVHLGFSAQTALRRAIAKARGKRRRQARSGSRRLARRRGGAEHGRPHAERAAGLGRDPLRTHHCRRAPHLCAAAARGAGRRRLSARGRSVRGARRSGGTAARRRPGQAPGPRQPRGPRSAALAARGGKTASSCRR